MGQLQLGTAKIDITPANPVPLAGFASRSGSGSFAAVKRPLFARIMAFRHIDDDGQRTTTVLVSADLIWWGSERVPALKRRIAEKWTIHEDAILLHATHTHSGPQTSERFSSYLGEPDLAYLDWLDDLIAEGIGKALNDAEPVSAEHGSGTCAIAINRRERTIKRRLALADHELIAIQYRKPDGTVKAVLVHYACHPVISRDNEVSSEFTGAAMQHVEETIGGGAVAAYLQGTCGDINPGREGKVCKGGDGKVKALGLMFARDVLQVLRAPMKPLKDAPLTARLDMLDLALLPLPSREELEAGQNEQTAEGEWSRRLLEEPGRLLRGTITLELTRLRLGDGMELLGMNGEIVSAYGMFVKKLTNGCMLPLGYTNGMIGYVPTAAQLEKGGYEPDGSRTYFLLPARLEPANERLILDRFERIASESGLVRGFDKAAVE